MPGFVILSRVYYVSRDETTIKTRVRLNKWVNVLDPTNDSACRPIPFECSAQGSLGSVVSRERAR